MCSCGLAVWHFRDVMDGNVAPSSALARRRRRTEVPAAVRTAESLASFPPERLKARSKLEETVRYERRYGNKLAPMLVEQCVDFIRQRGLREEGLFRLPGQANLVKELQDAFDCGEKPSFDRDTDVHTVASLLKLYLRELPEPVVPFSLYDDFLACTKLLSKDDATGVAELRKLVQRLPPVNYNLLTYICRFLDEVQSYSGVNKMSVQNLATVFGPNILRPKIEDPVAIMEGTVLVQQLMAVLIGRHDALFPDQEDVSTAIELVNNNNNELPPHRPLAIASAATATGQSQNAANNNTTQALRQCVWDVPDSPPPPLQHLPHHHHHLPPHPHPHPPTHVDNGSPPSPNSVSPRNSLASRFDLTRSPPLTLKKNPAFSKGSGIVTNGSFSSTSPGADPGSEKSPTHPPGGGGGGGGGGGTGGGGGGGSLPGRRNGTLKGSGTKMGTGGVTNGSGNGVARLGVSSTDVVNGSLNGRHGLWVPNGHVTLRDNSKTRDGEHGHSSSSQNRLSTYDNVQLNHLNLQHQHHHQQQQQQQNPHQHMPGDGGGEDKQSVDSATWSTSSCEISLPDNSTSCRSSTTTCPEQDFYAGHYDESDGPAAAAVAAAAAREREGAPPGGGSGGEAEGRNGTGGRSRRGTSSSDTSDGGYPVSNGTSSHSALHSLVAGLKQEMNKQKNEYEARINSLEQRNVELETDMASLNEELDQERKKYTMVEIKLRNAERAKDDAERRNHMLQKEMEQFFSTFGDLTAGPGATTATAAAAEPPRRSDRANSIWIQ
ncbi:unnamed protein product [Merluccius merluccius]